MNSIDDKLKLLQPILGPVKIQRLRQIYFFEDDYRQKKELENYIDLLISRHVKKHVEDEVALPPPTENLCDGDVDLGEVEYLGKKLYPFKLKHKDLTRHVGLFGSTGSGKTTMAKNIIQQLHKNGIPFLIFDWEQSYRDLIHDIPNIQVFTVGKDIHPLFLNLLTVPPGIEYDEYIKSIIAIISEDYIGGIGADTMLMTYLEMAYQETKQPFFEDLKHIVLREINNDMGKRGRLHGRSGLWKETVSREIRFMSAGASGRVINPRRHYPLEKLFNKPIVLEFGNLKNPHDRKFFIHVILNWLTMYNHYHGIQSEDLKQVLIFEEFHNIAMKSKEDNLVSSLYREARKYGISLMALDQTPSEIPNSIFANLNTKVSFSLGTRQDISAMSNAMNLDRNEGKYFGMLSTGQAIVSVKQRYPACFLIRPYFVKQTANITDDELRMAMEKHEEEWRQNSLQSSDRGIIHLDEDSDIPPPLAPLERILLTHIIEKPFQGVSDRIKQLGIHPPDISSLHTSLVEKGLIKSVYVDHRKLFEVTQKGKEVAGIPVPKQKTRGGVQHTYWIKETVQFLKKLELQPACEVDGIDIVDRNRGIAIEIETGKSDMHGNFMKLKNSQCSNRYMIATNKDVELKLKAITKKDPSIQIFFVKDFLQLTKEQIIS